MDEISKKELLAETGISYGQLYRWKREGLIPEEWFVKRAAFTGQETFFPRARMLDRVRTVLAMKDDWSLDDIRDILRAEESRVAARDGFAAAGMDAAFLRGLDALETYPCLRPEAFAAVCAVYEAGREAGVKEKELRALTNEAIERAAEFERGPAQMVFFRIGGKAAFVFAEAVGTLVASGEAESAKVVSVGDALERLRVAHPAAFIKHGAGDGRDEGGA